MVVHDRGENLPMLPVEDRRRLVFELYGAIKKTQGAPGYSEMHQLIHRIQPRLEKKLGARLGYTFQSRNLYGPWDECLQEDLVVMDAVGLVHNHDRETGRLVTHKLSTTPMGDQSAEILGDLSGDDYLMGHSRKRLHSTLVNLIRPPA